MKRSEKPTFSMTLGYSSLLTLHSSLSQGVVFSVAQSATPLWASGIAIVTKPPRARPLIHALLQSFVQQNDAILFPVQALDMVPTLSTEQRQRVRKRIQLKACTNRSLPRQSCIRAAHPCSFARCFSSALVIPAPHYGSNGTLCNVPLLLSVTMRD